jgi:hypothetical protein
MMLGGTALVAAACTREPVGTLRPSATPPAPDERLRRVIVAAEAELVALYAATQVVHPQLAEVLALVEDHHRRHSAAVGSSGRVAPAVRPTSATPDGASATESATPTPVATATDPPVAADPEAALRALRAAEENAAEARLRDCLRCEDPALAELVAAIAAGEAANSVLLPTAP